MRVTVNRDTCCGSGLCVVAVPQVFGQDDETVVVVNEPEPPAALADLVRQAARRCPTGTIRLLDDA
ncbi:ferredoxin [Streptosporangium longisporum]|uniref:Ferredoxin n=1 Tax=Streptosporangium longisporum TaxID=46187 RepID=A0ABP6LK83_9ACTN